MTGPTISESPAPSAEPRAAASAIAGAAVRPGDRVFRAGAVAASAVVLAIMVAIAIFLVYRTVPALRQDTASFLRTKVWLPEEAKPVFGIAALLFHTLVTSVVAMLIALPVALGVALFVTYYAPRRLSQAMGYFVDLLAAVPSVIYGLWGFFFLAPRLTGLTRWLDRWVRTPGLDLGPLHLRSLHLPLFQYRLANTPNNLSDLTAGMVLAIMILPIISSISREVFRQVPRDQVEAALAIGATRWEMIRTAVLPFGRSGVVSASILGLGRALGETLAVAIILAPAYTVSFHLTEGGGITFASNIALKFSEASDIGIDALLASGLCLFVITLAVNFSAQLLIRRRREA
jgi:phosphate transport system permease protein